VFDFLFEGRAGVYVVLALAGIIALLLWWQKRQRKPLVVLIVTLVLAGLYTLLHFLVETDTEKVDRTLREMAQAMDTKDMDRLFSHVSRDFTYGGKSREEIRRRLSDRLHGGDVKGVAIRDFRVLEFDREKKLLRVEFAARGQYLDWHGQMRCQGEFIRENDGQWRLKKLITYRPPVNSEEFVFEP